MLCNSQYGYYVLLFNIILGPTISLIKKISHFINKNIIYYLRGNNVFELRSDIRENNQKIFHCPFWMCIYKSYNQISNQLLRETITISRQRQLNYFTYTFNNDLSNT